MYGFLSLLVYFSQIKSIINKFFIVPQPILPQMTMNKKFLLENEGKTQAVKEISLTYDPQKLKLMMGSLSWKILGMLSEKEMYPLEIAKQLGMQEQKIYYHVRKLAEAGAIRVEREEKKKGPKAKYYRTVSPAFGIEFPGGYKPIKNLCLPSSNKSVGEFFGEFLKNDTFNGKIVVGSPQPHGPFKTSARDGHYAAHLALFLGQFAKMPTEFAVKLDVDVKVEKEEKNNLILVGGPGTNLLTQEMNDYLPTNFIMQSSPHGFMLGGLSSKKTGQIYSLDNSGLIAKIVNPWDKTKRIIVLAGNKAVGTKACVIALTNFWKKTLEKYKGEDTFTVVITGYDLDGDGKVDSIEVCE
jgi:DNA-binding transcriptional ArsR family regulator